MPALVKWSLGQYHLFSARNSVVPWPAHVMVPTVGKSAFPLQSAELDNVRRAFDNPLYSISRLRYASLILNRENYELEMPFCE